MQTKLCCTIFLAVFAIILSLSTSVPVSQFHCLTSTGAPENSSSTFSISQCPANSRPLEWSERLIAYARYANRINATGWAELEVVTSPLRPDAVQAYAAGLLEGHLTAPLISSYRRNNRMGALFDRSNGQCKGQAGFVTDNLRHTISRVLASPHDDYWREVGLVLYQIAGLDDGASGRRNLFLSPHLNVHPCGTYQMNMDTESDDLQLIKAQVVNPDRDSHCSAFIKYIPGDDSKAAEVLVAHNTWGSYHNMLRLLKKYTLNYSTSAAKTVTMSGYPGQVFSHDDFYVTSQGLVVQETSIENFNASSWGHINSQMIVLEFIRNAVANRMASNGSEWARIFSRHNSGTYNNQFMIVDYKKLNTGPGTGTGSIERGLLTILEQLPHLVHFEDLTEHLRQHRYWASYNIPYFEDVYAQAGFKEMTHRRGAHYSYQLAPRAQMFAREQAKVGNLSALMHLMRYNDFRHDPLARCSACSPPYSAEYAIAARADLNDPHGRYPFRELAFRATGATDAKMTSRGLVERGEGEFVAVAGPTDQGQPPFDWRTFSDKSQLHFDQPAVWHFKPVITRWNSTKDSGEFPYFGFDM